MTDDDDQPAHGTTGRRDRFEATGKIAAEDYRDILIPALEQAATTGKARFIIVMRAFNCITGGGLWQDLRMASNTSAPGNGLRSSQTSTG